MVQVQSFSSWNYWNGETHWLAVTATVTTSYYHYNSYLLLLRVPLVHIRCNIGECCFVSLSPTKPSCGSSFCSAAASILSFASFISLPYVPAMQPLTPPNSEAPLQSAWTPLYWSRIAKMWTTSCAGAAVAPCNASDINISSQTWDRSRAWTYFVP